MTEFRNTIIYLIGFPGVGKYTIAKALCEKAAFRLVDNHLVNNPVFSVIDLKNGEKLDEVIWDQIAKIRDVVLYTIENLSHPDYNFIFTNVLLDGDEKHQRTLDQVKELAAKRQAVFIPVRLTCALKENVMRISQSQRGERFKSTNPTYAQSSHANEKLIPFDHPHVLDLDITGLFPEQAAEIILVHATKIHNRQG